MELDDTELLRARDELLAVEAGPLRSASRIWRDSIVAAVCLALAGTGCFWLVLSWIESTLFNMYPSSSPKTGVWSQAGMTVVVGGCVFSAGLFCWRWFAIRGRKVVGVLAGALSAVVSHFLIPTALCVRCVEPPRTRPDAGARRGRFPVLAYEPAFLRLVHDPGWGVRWLGHRLPPRSWSRVFMNREAYG